MLRILVRLTLALTTTFTLVTMVIQARPYDDSELRQVLTPSDSCTTPCFIGVQPGVTTVDEAVVILQSSAWTRDLTNRGESSPLAVTWKWSSAAPHIFHRVARFYDGALRARNGIVQHIELEMSVSLGDTRLAWGAPEGYSYLLTTGSPIGGPPPRRPSIFVYADRIILAPTTCNYLRQFWRSDVTVILGDAAAWLEVVIPVTPSNEGQPLMRFITDKTQFSCRLI